jgi:hypothetical protein
LLEGYIWRTTGNPRLHFLANRRKPDATYLAKNFWDGPIFFLTGVSPRVPKKAKTRKTSPTAIPFHSPYSEITPDETTLGRPTIQDRFLVGSRNQWVSLLESYWADIGWELISIRNRRKSSIQGVSKALEPLQGAPHNPGIAAPFFRESFEEAVPAEIRETRSRSDKLGALINSSEAKFQQQQRSCTEANGALAFAKTENLAEIQEEIVTRSAALLDLESKHKTLLAKRDSLYTKSQGQEAFIYRSELLDFLRSGRYAVSPRNIANAVAGLPVMKWRQSFYRCSGMPIDLEECREYCVYKIFATICHRQPVNLKGAPIAFFQTEIPRLPKKYGHARQFLLDNWYDLRAAIEECWETKRIRASIPFVLASIFILNVMQPKNPAERIIADRNKLIG